MQLKMSFYVEKNIPKTSIGENTSGNVWLFNSHLWTDPNQQCQIQERLSNLRPKKKITDTSENK